MTSFLLTSLCGNHSELLNVYDVNVIIYIGIIDRNCRYTSVFTYIVILHNKEKSTFFSSSFFVFVVLCVNDKLRFPFERKISFSVHCLYCSEIT